MDKKKKIVNADDNDVLNPMASTRNYGAGTEDGMKPGEDEEEDTAVGNPAGDDLKENEPLPDEIANPEEQDDDDKMA